MKLKTLPEKVRRPYKKCSAVTFEAGFMLIRERAVAVIIEIFIVAGVKRRTRRRIPAKKKLTARITA